MFAGRSICVVGECASERERARERESERAGEQADGCLPATRNRLPSVGFAMRPRLGRQRRALEVYVLHAMQCYIGIGTQQIANTVSWKRSLTLTLTFSLSRSLISTKQRCNCWIFKSNP